MNLKELRERRAKLLADAQQLMLGDNVTAEIRAKVNEMISNAESLSTLIAQAEAEERANAELSAAEQRTAAEQRGRNLQLPNPGESTGDTAEERKKEIAASFRNYLQTGKVETRDLTLGANGVLIPTNVAEPVVAQKSAGQIYDIVGKMSTTTGAPIKVPMLNDTANSFVLNSTAITVTDPAVSGITISVDDYRANPILLDNSLIQDASFDLTGYVVEAIYARYQRDMSSALTVGNANNIGGLTAITAGVTGAASLTIGYADFVSMLATLDPAYQANAVWTMSNATLGSVLKILDSQNRPIFVPYTDGPNSGFVGQILGFPVKINQYLPVATVAGNKAVQFGDFKAGYTLREVQPGIAVRRLDERYGEQNKTAYVAFCRVGGAVTDAGTHPILSLTIKA